MAVVHFAYGSKISCIETGTPVEIAVVNVDDSSQCFHGCSDENTDSSQLLQEFAAFLQHYVAIAKKKIVLVAFGAVHERALLESALEGCGHRLPPNTTWLCTRTICTAAAPVSISSLHEFCALRGILISDTNLSTRGTALTDAKAGAQLFRSLFEDPHDAEYSEGLAAVYEMEMQEMQDAEDARHVWEGEGEWE